MNNRVYAFRRVVAGVLLISLGITVSLFGNTYFVSSTNDNLVNGTLRKAITDANSVGGLDTIDMTGISETITLPACFR